MPSVMAHLLPHMAAGMCLFFFSGVMAAAPRVTCMQRSAAPLQQQSKPNNKYLLESKMFAVGHTMSNAPDLF